MNASLPAEVRQAIGTPALFASDADAIVAIIIALALVVAILDLVRARFDRNKLKIRRRN